MPHHIVLLATAWAPRADLIPICESIPVWEVSRLCLYPWLQRGHLLLSSARHLGPNHCIPLRAECVVRMCILVINRSAPRVAILITHLPLLPWLEVGRVLLKVDGRIMVSLDFRRHSLFSRLLSSIPFHWLWSALLLLVFLSTLPKFLLGFDKVCIQTILPNLEWHDLVSIFYIYSDLT